MIGSERNFVIYGGNMKMVKINKGTKTVYKMVPDDWKEEEGYDLRGDLTTGDRKLIGFTDISDDKWSKIFGKKDKNSES